MKLAILGAGAWGTALAISFAGRHPSTLWGRDAEVMADIGATRVNGRYLPNHLLPPQLAVTTDLTDALAEADLAIVAVPVAGLRETLQALTQVRPGMSLLWACKGFDPRSGFLPHQIVVETVPASTLCGVLSGPSFAEEVAAGKPSAVTLASPHPTFARETARALHGHRLRLYSSTDLVGVEIAGALKNVIAIAAGLSDELDLGLNARAALITRGLAEIARLGVALGGRAETFMGLSGLGDLVLTCTGALSRNYRVGQGLARGNTLAAIMENLGHVAEGATSATSAVTLARHHQVEMPITEAVQAVLAGTIGVREAVDLLLAREPRPE